MNKVVINMNIVDIFLKVVMEVKIIVVINLLINVTKKFYIENIYIIYKKFYQYNPYDYKVINYLKTEHHLIYPTIPVKENNINGIQNLLKIFFVLNVFNMNFLNILYK